MSRTAPARRTLTLLAAISLVACGASPEVPGTTAEPAEDGATASLTVVVTTSILGDVVSEIVGVAGSVEVLMGPGVDPHEFQASASQAASLRTADLVVINGLGLEEGMVGVIEAAETEGARVVAVAEAVDPLRFAGAATAGEADEDDHDHDDADHEDHDHDHDDADHDDTDHDDAHNDDADHDEDHGHQHGDEDPHFWFDPLRMAEAVDIIAAALGEAAPEAARTISANAEEYRSRLLTLHDDLQEIFASIPNRTLVATHDNLGYLAHRYDFEVVGTVIPGGSTLAQPSSADLADLVAVIELHSVPAIFTDSFTASAVAEAVAAELDHPVEVVSLYTDALGEPGSGADTYLGLMETNAGAIAEALG